MEVVKGFNRAEKKLLGANCQFQNFFPQIVRNKTVVIIARKF